MQSHIINWQSGELKLGRRTAIMGIVNVTPDSFSDGGRFYSLETAVEQAHRLVKEGADIIDIGGESSRPFAEAASIDIEMQRVVPVIEKLAGKISVPISIDTTKAAVAQAALDAGASIINDISALEMDPDMAGVAVRYNAPVILMHMQGEPRTMQLNPSYKNVVTEVRDFLKAAADKAIAAGIAKNKLILDPGIGFGKSLEHNLLLIRHLKVLEDLNLPLLAGPSRKAFIRKLLGGPSQDALPANHPDVQIGTQAAVCAAAIYGAHILRVHDVMNTKAALCIIDAIRSA
ncbi:MAG: dihydropteroate synthase [Desulfobacteraceae bacterium]|nr:dihydropteroate synthase [Desulfobacteraceae bacterium]